MVKRMKKILAEILLVCMMISSVIPAYAVEASEIPEQTEVVEVTPEAVPEAEEVPAEPVEVAGADGELVRAEIIEAAEAVEAEETDEVSGDAAESIGTEKTAKEKLLGGTSAAGEWSKLEAALAGGQTESVENQLEISGNEITLLADFTATEGAESLSVSGTKTLDLNGHVINGAELVGSVITVSAKANLTLTDNSEDKTHKFTVDDNGLWTLDEQNGTKTITGGIITGGNGSQAGGVYVEKGDQSTPGGTFTMKGGNIVGNTSSLAGGGVYLATGATFNMDGGSIVGNKAGDSNTGGGVCLTSATFIMNGGIIEYNAAKAGGGVYSDKGSFTMTDGEIGNNTATMLGGGVGIGNGTFSMSGGAISGNTAATYGGGVYYNNGTVTLDGSAKITGNTKGTGKDEVTQNVYLPSDKTIITIGTGEEAPVKGMSIGVKTSTAPTENNPVRISTNGTADDLQYVFADDAQLEVAFNTEKGCLELKTTPKYTVTFDSQGGSEVAAQTVSKGEKAVKPADPTKTDKIFAGWYKDAGCTAGQKYDFETPVTAGFTLYAKWEEKQVTITYLGFGGSPFLEIGQLVGLPAESWPRPDEEPGYVFDWWCADEACTEKWDFETLIMEDTTLYSKWKKAEYTVTFDSQGGSTVAPQNALYEEKVRNPEPAPEKEGFAFGGWYKEKECRTAWNFAQDTVQQDMTLYARWIKNEEKKATVSGTVTEKGSGSVAGAAVELCLGTVKAAATVTDNEGHYKFDNVPTGTYNIVVTATGDKIKTVMVNVNEAGEFSADVELPKEDVSSKVEHKGEKQEDEKSDVSQTVVGGLDKIAEKMAQPNQKVTIKLTVEPKTDIDTPTQKDIKKEAGTERKVEFLDLSLMMQVGAQSEKNIGDENDQLLTIVIPFDFTGVNVTGMMILRNHGGKVEKLTASPNADGEYFAVDRTAGTLTIYAKKFSEYALAYEPQQKPDPDPSSDSDSEPVFTGTWNNPVQNGAWKQDANGIWSYTTTQVFRNTWGYIVNPYAGEGQNKADWFYFDQYGHMLTGWQLIGGKWYYLNPVKDGTFGACLLGPGKTPDGYEIDASGAWTGR